MFFFVRYHNDWLIKRSIDEILEDQGMEKYIVIIGVVAIVLMIIIIFNQYKLSSKLEQKEIDNSIAQLVQQQALLEKNLENLLTVLRNEMSQIRNEANQNARNSREESAVSFTGFQNSTLARMAEIAGLQKDQLELFARQLGTMVQNSDTRLEAVRQTVENKLKLLQEDNSKQLEQIRTTVDEKLHATLEQRLGESFKQVSERLEMVHKGLGEMQTLAAGVGDLKKVLSNVKTRGIWGEVQLAAILEEILTPGQYDVNIATCPGSNERVEFAVKLPGRQEGEGTVWLPIDAKFPQEDYLRLVAASEEGNQTLAEEAGRQLENRIRLEARNIHDKYLSPPHTTDFGIMFLPTESLYAEVAKRPYLMEELQKKSRVIVAGPSTMAALLNSLAIGFHTLAIEKRSSEVWLLLGIVKTEFGKFGDILEKTQKKLTEASHSLETASRKSRNIEKKLRQVQEIPAVDDQMISGIDILEAGEDNEESM
ncbi:MAG TPA: DNA recombination protein RmuC [Syntrophomonas sp.]|nr:DNA recombination protein RmuC [Syntrophomonas sp.]